MPIEKSGKPVFGPSPYPADAVIAIRGPDTIRWVQT